jgi:hypothetical protein
MTEASGRLKTSTDFDGLNAAVRKTAGTRNEAIR